MAQKIQILMGGFVKRNPLEKKIANRKVKDAKSEDEV